MPRCCPPWWSICTPPSSSTNCWQLFWLVSNLFDNREALYGTYFDPDGTSALVTPALTDARTLTRRPPMSFQLGVKLKF
jgi:hypothetical protein